MEMNLRLCLFVMSVDRLHAGPSIEISMHSCERDGESDGSTLNYVIVTVSEMQR